MKIKITLDQTIDEVNLVPSSKFKLATGWFTLFSKGVMDKIGIDKLQKYIPSFILNIIKNINHVSYQNIYDFYTSQRNTDKNWTLPSNYVFNNNNLNNYNQLQANTSFGGGSNIFGLICIDDTNYNILKENKENNENNENAENLKIEVILDILNSKNITLNDFKGKYGYKLNIDINNKSAEILLLSLYTTDIYNNGMHSLWNFIEKTHVYALSLTNDSKSDNLKFNGYLLYNCDNIVPELHISIQKILEQYISITPELKSLVGTKGNKLYDGLMNKLRDENIDKFISDIDKLIEGKDYNFNLMRGYSLVFTDFKALFLTSFTIFSPVVNSGFMVAKIM
jgi:hypothetical protein